MEKKGSNVLINFKTIIKYILYIDKKYILVCLSEALFNGLFPALSVLIFQNIVNLLQINTDFKIIIKYIILYILIDLFLSIFNSYLIYFKQRFNKKFTLFLSQIILTKASLLSLSNYEDSDTYDVIHRAQNENGEKLISYYNRFISIFTQFINLITYIIILIKFNAIIIPIIMVLPIIKFIVNSKYNLINFKIIRSRTNDSRKNWYHSYLLTNGIFYKELSVFDLHKYFIDKYVYLLKKFNKQDLDLSKSKVKCFTLLNTLENLIDGIIFIYISYLGANQVILLGNIVTYIKSIISAKTNVSSILFEISDLISDSLFISQLFEYLNLGEKKTGGVKINKIESIEFRNVCYKYPNSQKYVLKDISFYIKENEKIALVGTNGSGKSTLIKLIIGFYDNYEGEIYINGVDARKLDSNYFLRRISTLFQDFIKYETTLEENFYYGNLSQKNNYNFIEEYLRMVGMLDYVNGLEKGVKTQLGSWFDKGINLSIGQWQKIALARTLIKESDLYILDEPNSALDIVSQSEINKIYKGVLQDKMVIIVTHNLEDLFKIVDRIIILDDGNIVETIYKNERK